MITLQEIHERDKRPPSVTVYMISYNHAKYIDEAMRGVLMQKTDFPVNIVVHDDASPDGSGEIIQRYAMEHPNITAITEETNCYQKGIPFFHKILPYMTGKYIAFCECDDFWIDDHKLQIQADYLENNLDCMAVYSNTLPVNKSSEYDESVRGGCYPKTGEGDYPCEKVMGVEHQLASCMMRNCWRLMSPEDIDFYLGIKSNGDNKILALCLQLGRVHYFSEEFAAHRRVVDEGDSWSARMKRKTDYERLQINLLSSTETYRMIEHFSGEKYYRKYIYVLFCDLRERVRHRRSVIKDIPLHECYQYRNIPWFIWPAFAGYASYRAARKIAKSLLPEKLLTLMRKARYNQPSALSPQPSALKPTLYSFNSKRYTVHRKLRSAAQETCGVLWAHEVTLEAAA